MYPGFVMVAVAMWGALWSNRADDHCPRWLVVLCFILLLTTSTKCVHTYCYCTQGCTTSNQNYLACCISSFLFWRDDWILHSSSWNKNIASELDTKNVLWCLCFEISLYLSVPDIILVKFETEEVHGNGQMCAHKIYLGTSSARNWNYCILLTVCTYVRGHVNLFRRESFLAIERTMPQRKPFPIASTINHTPDHPFD